MVFYRTKIKNPPGKVKDNFHNLPEKKKLAFYLSI